MTTQNPTTPDAHTPTPRAAQNLLRSYEIEDAGLHHIAREFDSSLVLLREKKFATREYAQAEIFAWQIEHNPRRFANTHAALVAALEPFAHRAAKLLATPICDNDGKPSGITAESSGDIETGRHGIYFSAAELKAARAALSAAKGGA